MAVVITFSGKQLKTLYPDGTDFKALTYPEMWVKNRIGERKKLSLAFRTDASVENKYFYFNPALFGIAGGAFPFSPGVPPLNYYGYSFGTFSGAFTATMAPVAQTPYANDLLKNFKVEISFEDAQTFTITVDYFHIYDLKNFLTPSIDINKNKLLKDNPANPSILNVSGSTIYTDDTSQPGYFLMIQNPMVIMDYGVSTLIFDSYKAGFYAKNEHQADPYFNTPVWNLFKQDEATAIATLNTADNNQLVFKITSPSNVTEVFMWMIRTDTNNNGVDMNSNYEATFIRLDGTTNGIGDKLIANYIAPTSLGGGVYKVASHIDKTKIAISQKYRFIAVVYTGGDEEAPFQINSFISEEYTVFPSPFDGGTKDWGMGGSIKDYQTAFTGNDLKCVVEERLQSNFGILYGATGFSDDILARLGLVVPNDMRRYMTKIQVEMYEDTGITRQYFDRQTLLKMSPTTYTASPSLALVMNGGGDGLQINYDYLVRYEAWLQNMQTKVGSVFLGSPTSNMNMAGRLIIVEFTIYLYYDDYILPFTDVIHLSQKLRPADYNAILKIENNDNSAIGEGEYFCGDTCFKAELTATQQTQKYNLITTAEPSPGFSPTTNENETWVGAQLPQQTSDKFSSQEVFFSQTESTKAKFCLKASKFIFGIPYKISAIAKKIP